MLLPRFWLYLVPGDIGLPGTVCQPLPPCVQMVSTLPALETAFLRYADLRGKLDCRVLAPPKLRRLSLSGNAEIVREVPGCFLQVGKWGAAGH